MISNTVKIVPIATAEFENDTPEDGENHANWASNVNGEVRTVKSAETSGVALITPKIGEFVELDGSFTSQPWWDTIR